MDVWIRRSSDWSHRQRLPLLDWEIPFFSAANDAGSLTIPGEYDDLNGEWAVVDGRLYLIDSCSPKSGATKLKILLPKNAFSRTLRYSGDSAEEYGPFIAGALTDEYIDQADPVYAMPYLSVSSSDTTEFIFPVLDGETYTLLAIIDQAADAGVFVDFAPGQAGIAVTIAARSPATWALFAGDGHTQIASQTYTSSIVAKADVRSIEQDRDTGEVTVLDSGTFYWHEDGTVDETPPDPRIRGEWVQVDVTGDTTLLDGAVSAMASNAEAYKLEFWSDRVLRLGDEVVCRFGGILARGTVSYARTSFKDRRTFYRAGRASTTLTEKVGASARRSGSRSGGSGGQIFPVGAIYLSTSSENPGRLFGGVWERIRDTFLLAAGDDYAPGTSGGEAEHKLTAGELPTLSGSTPNIFTGGQSGGTSGIVKHTVASNRQYTTNGTSTNSWQSYEIAFGGDQPHNNMPPYLAVYVWKRTA